MPPRRAKRTPSEKPPEPPQVDGNRSGLPEQKKTKKGPKFPEELQKYVPQAEAFLRTNHELLSRNIAGDASVKFKIGNGFFIDLESGEVNLDIRGWQWMEKHGISEDMMLWATCHEIAHFRDLLENPEGMLKKFEYLEKRAAEIAPRILEALEKNLGKIPEYMTREVPFGSKGRKKPYVQVFAYRQLHTLYNAIDDMFVNRSLGELTQQFHHRKGTKRDEVKNLYRDILFPTNASPEGKGKPPRPMEAADYEQTGKAKQLVYHLLRKRMVPDQHILVSPEVRQVLETGCNRAMKKAGVSLEEHMDTITQYNRKANRDPAQRAEWIKLFVEKPYINFLLKDLETMDPPPPPKPSEGGEGGKGGEPGPPGEPQDGDDEGEDKKGKDGKKKKDQHGKPNNWEDDGNPEPIDLDFIRDYIKHLKQRKKEEEDRAQIKQMSPEERAQRADEQNDRQISEEHNVPPCYAKEYREYEERVDPYVEQLATVFEKTMKAIDNRITSHLLTGFKRGKFDQGRFIKKYSEEIATERFDDIPWEKLTTYMQKEFNEKISLFPTRITIRLVLDGSGSMTDKDITACKLISVLILKAITAFETNINLRYKPKPPFRVNTEIRMFGSPGESKIVKRAEDSGITGDEEMADRFRAMKEINNQEYGGTCDAEPLWDIHDGMTHEYEEQLQAGKAQDLIFVVTDGGSMEKSDGSNAKNGPHDTWSAIDALSEKGVAVRGLQIKQSYEQRKDEEEDNKEEDKHTVREVEDKPLTRNKPLDKMSEEDFDGVSDDEKFRQIHGENGRQVSHPADIPPTIAKLLASFIEQMKFRVESEGIDFDDEDEEEYI